MTETARVDLVQIEVTAWPRMPDSDACLGLTMEDFELYVDGKPREIYSVDAIGSEEEAYAPDAAPEVEKTPSGLSIVLYFDLWHLNLCDCKKCCLLTSPLAFQEARRLVREELRDGDRLLLVTFAGWPVIHYGWLRTREEALAALDRLEKNRQVVSPRKIHSHHAVWIEGIESLFLALGRFPGRKDVIYLGEDRGSGKRRFDDVAMRIYEIAARAQANGVVLSTIDVLDSCRAFISLPAILNPISRDTGGEFFRTDRIVPAVRTLRSMRRCRYLVSFRKDPKERRQTPSVTVKLKGERNDVVLHAPSSFQTPQTAPSRGERDDALFLLPRFGRGIGAEVSLWPYRPSGKRWQALALARIERTDEEAWPQDLTELRMSLIVREGSRTYAAVRKTIEGEELSEFRAMGDERLIVVPVERIRPGEATVDLTVTADAEGVSASVRKHFTIPEQPAPGEAGPWVFSDRFVRFGESVVRAPSLDGTLSPGETGSLLAFACRGSGDEPSWSRGRLVPLAGGEPVPLMLNWVEPPRRSQEGCGWLVGEIPDSLAGGFWSFEPPEEFGKSASAQSVEFYVLERESPEVLPQNPPQGQNPGSKKPLPSS